ncbi:MAG: DUF5682 family protein, partial [Defluviitaleaceae bacterium]|nr:DUF5682 family protein [Defluviitaleaceae bacterium]
MEESLQCVSGIERVNIFGVRHLSPAASHHLLRLLDRVCPKCVLIEGPADADGLLVHLSGEGVKPPVAILAYTAQLPIETVLYPFAEYSPEYQAVRWAVGRASVRFIDLPSGVLLSLNKWRPNADSGPTCAQDEKVRGFYERAHNLYDEVAALDKSLNFDDYFEKTFEHNLSEGSYEKALKLESSEVRAILEPMEADALPETNARGFLRESYMAMRIQEAIAEGYAPGEIVVVTGAYHADRLLATPPMTGEEFRRLPQLDARMTLMPYSFYRLSSRTGYGAGNSAPAYYQLMWECMKAGRHDELPVRYMSLLGRYVREKGGYCGTSNVIEAVRLARGLAYLKDGSIPTLADLHDAATAAIGHGERGEIAEALAMLDVGTAFGFLPEGISQTPVQDDFNREIRQLRLDKYKSTVTAELELDLRENTRVKSREAAFIDLDRSTFLHRLEFLGIGFAKKQSKRQQDATWREIWSLQWTPEVEIQVVEAVLKGETIELAAAFTLKERIGECADVAGAAQLIASACVCKLTEGIGSAISALQRLTADSGDFIKAADACFELSQQLQYGNLRKFDTQPLVPLVGQLFLRGSLLLVDYATCDDAASVGAASAINAMHIVSQENYSIVDDETWVAELTSLAARDDRNAKLSGLAFSILLERNLVDEDFCAKEVSRRLSPGIPADIGAGWFEGMSMRNRYALLSRTGLWQELDAYIKSLDDEQFKRSVVFMRRAFSGFEPREKNSV